MTTDGPIFLDRIDAVPLEDDEFSFSFNSWVSTTVDVLNEVIVDIQDQLNGLGIAAFPPPLTTAQITAIINRNAVPVLPVGATWFDTTLGKLRVLTTAAVAGVSDGVTQVVTSV